MHFPVATPNLSYSAACVSASKLQICHCHLCHDQFPFPSRCWAWWATRWCWGNPSSCGATATQARCPSSTPCSAPTGTLPGRRWRRPRSEPSLTSRPSTRRRASKTSCAAQITASAGWTKRGKCYAPPLSVRHMQQPGQHIGKKKKKVKTRAECPIFILFYFSICRARVEAGAALSPNDGRRRRGAGSYSGVLRPGRLTSCQLHLVQRQEGQLPRLRDRQQTGGVSQDHRSQEGPPGGLLLREQQRSQWS